MQVSLALSDAQIHVDHLDAVGGGILLAHGLSVSATAGWIQVGPGFLYCTLASDSAWLTFLKCCTRTVTSRLLSSAVGTG